MLCGALFESRCVYSCLTLHPHPPQSLCALRVFSLKGNRKETLESVVVEFPTRVSAFICFQAPPTSTPSTSIAEQTAVVGQYPARPPLTPPAPWCHPGGWESDRSMARSPKVTATLRESPSWHAKHVNVRAFGSVKYSGSLLDKITAPK